MRSWLARRGRAARKALLPGVALAAIAIVAGVAAAWLVPLPERLHTGPSVVVRDAHGSVIHAFLAPDERWRLPVAIAEVDPDYLDALFRFEDKRFDSHLGVDPVAVGRAAMLNVSSGRVVSGGSTITMQLVRMLEPRPRTVGSKAIEALRAVQLELRLSKAEILRLYLQHIPYGRNVEGLESGAWAMFGHGSSELEAGEIATLLAIPQNPTARYPTDRNAERLREARNRVASRLLADGALPVGPGGDVDAVMAALVAAPVPAHLRAMPREAPHVAWWLRERTAAGVPRIDTTLDLGVQRTAEEILGEAQASLERRGIRHGSVVVIDHRTMEIVALVGNVAWGDEPGQQIAAFDVPRSPGSTLKPFVYALAIDEGLALPSHLVSDVPVDYGGYSPRNYDGSWAGLVELEEALSRSLNVPFVNLLGAVGTETLLGRLRRMGVTSLRRDPGFYGLSVAVGGVELTPVEVATIYAVLARDGDAAPIRLVRGLEPPAGGGDRALSAEASWLTRRALALRDRPDFPTRRRLSGAPRGIHWKTGTSTGRRDAWAVGSGPTFTAAVWLGNLDGEGSSHLVGADAAGPILFDVLEALHRGDRVPLDGRPTGLAEVSVCAYSGHVPGAACTQTRRVLARRASVPTESCPYHVGVEVDLDSGLAVGPGCRDGRRTEERSFVRWPSVVRRHVAARSGRLPEPPAMDPGCAPRTDDGPPRIVHPPTDHVALLLPGLPAETQRVPLEAATAGADRLAWFVDGELVQAASADDRVWWVPSPGRHEIVVSDARGRTSRRTLEVRVRD